MYISAEAKAKWDTMTDAERVAAIKAGWDNVPRVEMHQWATCTNCGQTADAGFIGRHGGHCYPCSKES